jgi:Ni/Co efflux regulator RcnB
MRTLILASMATAAMALAGPALAQHAGNAGGAHWSGAQGGQWHGGGQQWHNGGHWSGGAHGHDWGGKTGGHWTGGMRAPGGWAAYRHPARGWRLPSYWISPGFYIDDWADYGLSQPPYGYTWSRYYDDAVLADRDGQVWDSVSGIDWDQGDDGYADNGDYDYDYGHDVGPGPGAGYPPPPPGARVERREYRYEGGPPGVTYRCGSTCGGTVVNGYYYPPSTTTTVTVMSVPETTTTTTEYIEEPAPRVHHIVRVWRPAPHHHWTPRPKVRVRHKVRCLC